MGISLCIGILFLVLFIINVRSGQYDDMHTPSVRILFDNKHNNHSVNGNGNGNGNGNE